MSAAVTRRSLLQCSVGLIGSGLAGCRSVTSDREAVVVTGFELLPVRATYRTVWLFVRLHTNAGMSGVGEASDAFGFANTTAANADTMRGELSQFFRLIENRSPLDIQYYRQQGRARAGRNLVTATAYSALEQCLWDLAGQVLRVPTHALFGGRVRGSIPVYANINRATSPRTPEGFAESARRAFNDGFRAIKAAPFDNFPVNGTAAEINAHIDAGVDAVFAMRAAVGEEVALMIDCHSFFSIAQAIAIAERLEPVNLTWYEEPVPPDLIDSTLSVKGEIQQPMAGGELLFGLEGFKPLIDRHAFDVIMPDVKHCGGLLELLHIAALAQTGGIMVAPHNPSGPVSTAAAVQVGAVIPNCNYLELQYGEVDWRGGALSPAEVFTSGTVQVPEAPGFGLALNEALIRENQLPL